MNSVTFKIELFFFVLNYIEWDSPLRTRFLCFQLLRSVLATNEVCHGHK